MGLRRQKEALEKLGEEKFFDAQIQGWESRGARRVRLVREKKQ